ncbi:IS66-like element accessory protein TnpA [Rhodoplanes sp. SY1]|uniref:IS66-like element accessory protein TnpA n=1 Tax=Rhodoplanes sp. SY1 TaxID=3166646 RepID=UPI0038B4C8DD
MDNDRHQDSHEGERYQRVEVITGRRRRRTWSSAEKAAIVAESFEPGANVSEVARRHGLNGGLLFGWRRQAMAGALGRESAHLEDDTLSFVPVSIACEQGNSTTALEEESAPAAGGGAASAMIEIVIGAMTIRVPDGVDQSTLAAVLGAVRGLW